MLNLIINLLYINIFVCLVHEAGFFTYLDEWINDKFPFHHLPYIILCALCQTWWLSLLYIIICGPFNLMTIALCLINAHMTKIITPLYRLVENIMLKLLNLFNEWLNL